MTSTAAEINDEQADKLTRDLAAVVERIRSRGYRAARHERADHSAREAVRQAGPSCTGVGVFKGSDHRALVTPERGGFRAVTENGRTLASGWRTAVQAVVDG
jgi:hypothetical protein